jgi:hypothetical protein
MPVLRLDDARSSMTMPVMDVGIVRMRVPDPNMPMPVRMRFGARSPRLMRVLVVLVMAVQMLVRQLIVQMFVVMALADMKPDTDTHERATDCQAGR